MSQPDEFQPVSAFDVSDENPSMIAGHVRALQREVRDGFESLGRAILPAIQRLDGKLDVVIDRQNVLEARVAAVEAEQIEVRALVDKLNRNAARRRSAARKK